MKRKILGGVLLCGIMVWAADAQATVTVRFVPSSQIVAISDNFQVDIVADIPDPVVGWGLDFAIADPAVVAQVGPPAILSPWVAGGGGDGDGLAGLVFAGNLSGMGIPLATIDLQALALGTTDLVASFTVGDPNEGFALDDFGFADVVFEDGFVEVIPEPATLCLLVLGSVAAIRRRTSHG